MGGNGSRSSGILNTESGRRWKTIATLSDGAKVLELKNPTVSNKLPEESNTPNSVYAIFNKNGKDVKSIAKYDENGEKLFEIHTTPHKELPEHYHQWKDGKPVGEPKPLTKDMQKLLNDVRNLK